MNRLKEVIITAVIVTIVNLVIVGTFAYLSKQFGSIATKSDITTAQTKILTEIQVIQNDLKHFRLNIEKVESSQSKDRETLVNHLQSHIVSNNN